MLGAVNPFEREPEKQGRPNEVEILFMKKELKEFATAAIGIISEFLMLATNIKLSQIYKETELSASFEDYRHA